MSKERELLRRCAVQLNSTLNGTTSMRLAEEIEELLAQPEQEPEPVAWRYKTHNRYTYTEENYHELEGKPLYTKPPKREIEQEPVAWMYDWNIIEEEEYGETRYDNLTRAESITKSRAITNVRPLYLVP